nr:ATP-binding cassette domain-containing protein [uncultured Cardiobacterium sp.]
MKHYQSKAELTAAIQTALDKYLAEFADIPEAARHTRATDSGKTPSEHLAYQLGWVTALLDGERRERQGQVSFKLDSGEKSGKIVAELEHASFAYGNKLIINDFSAVIQRGDKIGLIGANGIGKTTFLKLILGELAPTGGKIRLGSKQEVAYFDQFRSALNENDTVFYTLGQGNDYVEIGGKKRHVMGYLEDFLFHPARAQSPVSSLSGGERNRLLLAKLFTRPANILVLDEPTNDLDIDTQELLEELLRDYAGTVFLVSHDRMFLDNVITQSIVFEGEGRLKKTNPSPTARPSCRTKNSANSTPCPTKSPRWKPNRPI